MSQTLAANSQALASSRYGALGGMSGGRYVSGPSGVILGIVSFPGQGKSRLLQDNPDAFIFNLDLASTVTPGPCPATIWPVLSPTGEILNDDGKPFQPSYDHVVQKLGILISLAKNNQPRPKTIGFDTLSAWIYWLQRWMPPNAPKLNLSREPQIDWKDLHGEAAWDWLYTHIRDTILSLKQAGYGVVVPMHVSNVKEKRKEGGNTVEITRRAVDVSDKLWRRIKPFFEFVGYLACVNEPVTTTRTITSVVGGRELKQTKTEVVTVPVRKIFTVDAEMNDYLKPRVGLPPVIDLSGPNAWQAFEKVYNTAMQPPAPPAQNQQ